MQRGGPNDIHFHDFKVRDAHLQAFKFDKAKQNSFWIWFHFLSFLFSNYDHTYFLRGNNDHIKIHFFTKIVKGPLFEIQLFF